AGTRWPSITPRTLNGSRSTSEEVPLPGAPNSFCATRSLIAIQESGLRDSRRTGKRANLQFAIPIRGFRLSLRFRARLDADNYQLTTMVPRPRQILVLSSLMLCLLACSRHPRQGNVQGNRGTALSAQGEAKSEDDCYNPYYPVVPGESLEYETKYEGD